MRLSPERILVGVATIVIVAACVAAFIVMDPPGVQRQRKLDERRIENLIRIESAIDAHAEAKDALPKDLEDAIGSAPWIDMPRDPETGAAYGYERIDATRYRLCAEFALRSRGGSGQSQGVPWEHPAGRHCFERERRREPVR